MICQHLLTHSFCPNRLWDKKVEISSLHPGWKKCFNPLGCSFHSFPFLRKLPEQTLESLLLTKQMFWSSGGGNGEHWISSLTPDAQFLIKLSNLSLRALARESPCSKPGNWTAPRFRRSRFTRTVLEIYSFFPSPVQDHQAREFGCSWILWEKKYVLNLFIFAVPSQRPRPDRFLANFHSAVLSVTSSILSTCPSRSS